jgi:hypothetical protein
MPGPVSDSYDPEFGTGYNAALVAQALLDMYKKISHVLKNKPPICVLDLVEDWANNDDESIRIKHTFTEKEWRLIRFAIERAIDSI